MSAIHRMNLNKSPYERIKSGSKTIEIRVNDEKRQTFKISDTIEFQHEEDEVIHKKIIGLSYYKDFQKLLASIDHKSLGPTDIDLLMKRLNTYYPQEQQEKYGVVAIYLG